MIQLQIMEEELVNYIEAPWDCQDLDPYREDPKGDGGREVMDSDMVVDSREEPGAVDADRPLCTCGGGCPKDMPTKEKQLCCSSILAKAEPRLHSGPDPSPNSQRLV